MLFVLRNTQQNLLAAIDYYLVTDDGKLVFDGSGTCVWIEQLEISRGVDGKAVIREFIRKIAEATQARGAYWVRKDKTGCTIKYYSRERLVRYATREEVKA